MEKATKQNKIAPQNGLKAKKKRPRRRHPKKASAGVLKLRSLIDEAAKSTKKEEPQQPSVETTVAPSAGSEDIPEPVTNNEAAQAGPDPSATKLKPRLKKRSSKDKTKTYIDNPDVVFIGNVPLAMERNELIKKMGIDPKIVKSVHFRSLPVEERFATNKRVAVIRGRLTNAKSSKNAYMTLVDEKHVQEVLKKNTMEVDGHYLFVNQSSPSSFSKFSRKKTVFVGRLPPSTTENELFDVFSNVGLVKDIRIIRDPKTCASKGFGFVSFDTRNAVPEAIEAFNNKEFKGYTLNVMKALDHETATERKAKARKGGKNTKDKNPQNRKKKVLKRR